MTRASPRRSSRARCEQPVSRRNFIELCERLTASTSAPSRRRGGGSGSRSTGRCCTRRSATTRRVSQRAFLRNLAPGRGVPGGGADAVGRRPSRPRSRRPSSRTASRPARSTGSPSTGRSGRPTGRSGSRPPARSCCPPAWRWSRTPTTRATSSCSARRCDAASSASRCRCSRTRWPSRTRGHGIAMVCTFGDLTDVTWWRELDLPLRPIIGRDGRLLPEPPAGVRRRAVRRSWREDRVLGPRPDGRAAAGERRPRRRAAAGHPAGEVLREGRHGRSRSSPRGSGTSGTADAKQRHVPNSWRRPRLTWHPAFMRVRYESWVSGLAGDWLISRQRFFGVPFPVWYPVDEAGSPVYSSPIVPDESQLPVDPASSAARVREASAACRAGSSAIPT